MSMAAMKYRGCNDFVPCFGLSCFSYPPSLTILLGFWCVHLAVATGLHRQWCVEAVSGSRSTAVFDICRYYLVAVVP